MARHSAVFDTQAQAEAAVTELRRMGVADAHLSFVGRHDAPIGEAEVHDRSTLERRDDVAVERVNETNTTDGGEYRPDQTAANTGKGLLAGAGVGALFGLAAAAIPGVGPFISAGVLAGSLGAAGTGAVAGAIVGGTAGSIAGALSSAGYTREEAHYYGDRIERGGVLVAVEDTHGVADSTVLDVLQRHGGHVYGH